MKEINYQTNNMRVMIFLTYCMVFLPKLCVLISSWYETARACDVGIQWCIRSHYVSSNKTIFGRKAIKN